MFQSMAENLVTGHKQGGNYTSFRNDVIAVLGFDPNIEEADFAEAKESELSETLFQKFSQFYQRKTDQIKEVLLPVVKDVYENQGHQYKRIAIPFTDGRAKMLPISADLKPP
jgi:preprotein translocase subunit SecA